MNIDLLNFKISSQILEEDFEELSSSLEYLHLLRQKKILVTGASGFIASYLVDFLFYLNNKKNFGIEVIAIVRNLAKAEKRFSAYKQNSNLSLVEYSFLAPLKLERKVDFVIHAASQASPSVYATDPVGTALPNSIGTYYLLDHFKDRSLSSFLFVSGGEVYGSRFSEVGTPVTEDDYGFVDPTQIRSCYAESKRMGENFCVSFSHQYQLNTKIARLFHTYGPGVSLNDGRVFSDFVKNILRNEDLVLFSDGQALRPFCYIKDAVQGMFCLLLNGESGRAYNIANPKTEVSIVDLANRLVKLFPEKNLSVVKGMRDKTQSYLSSPINRLLPSIEKAKKVGFNPTTTIEQGFKRTIESYVF